MFIRYARKRPVIQLAVSGTMGTEICDSLNVMVNKAMTAPVRQQRIKVTDMSFAAPDENILSSTPTSQELLLSRPVNTKLGPAPSQRDPQVFNLENKAA